MNLKKTVFTVFLAVSTQLSFADATTDKMIDKGLRFLGSLEKEIKFSEVLGKSNGSYGAGAQRLADTVPADIGAKDKQWIAWKKSGGNKESFISEVLDNSCSKTIQQLSARKNYITEVFVMDMMGATVCASPATSDYDQGDEEKWQAPFLKGATPFVGPVQKDESTGVSQAQVSYLLKDGDKKIGVITIGLKSK